MAKKTTLKELGQMLTHVVEHMATKEELEYFATKDDMKKLKTKLDGLKVKVAGIQNTLDREAVVRSDQKIPERVTKLKEKVFGRSRT
jgi:hypothetical protein